MNYRRPTEADLKLLAEMNYHLIRDEGHTNPMNLVQLEERMRAWLRGEFRGVIFEEDGAPVAYALYRIDPEQVYLRQFFVSRAHRRQGVGRRAMAILFNELWPHDRRILVEVLARNAAGHAFWRAVGFADYSVTLEIRR